MPASPIVEMKDISISFPGVKALDRVNFRLFPGEVHALMGENGAGKSTLIKALTGVYTIDEGTVIVSGRSRRLGGTADAQAAGISTVYQEVNLCTNLSIGENVMLRSEEHTSELQSRGHLVCRLLLEKQKHTTQSLYHHT